MTSVNKNLAILFPGVSYNTDQPLFYYAELKYYLKGYKIIKIDYGDCLQTATSFDKGIESIKEFVAKQVSDIDFSAYQDIVFISKSVGSIIAGWLENELNAEQIRHIYLTPIEKTLEYISSGKNISIVIAGTDDKYLASSVLKEHCADENVRLELIEGADHSLEVPGDMSVNIDILKRIVTLYK